MTEPSKTPRTDALAARLEGMELNFAAHKIIRELIALAGELEGQSVALSDAMDKLGIVLADRDMLRSRVEALSAENDALLRKIGRESQ